MYKICREMERKGLDRIISIFTNGLYTQKFLVVRIIPVIFTIITPWPSGCYIQQKKNNIKVVVL